MAAGGGGGGGGLQCVPAGGGEGVFRFVGPTWPSTQDTEFVDEAAAGRGATYVVRSVSRHGLESEPSAAVGWGAAGRRLYLPAAQR